MEKSKFLENRELPRETEIRYSEDVQQKLIEL